MAEPTTSVEKHRTQDINIDATVLEQVLIGGDLSTLTSPQRVVYYKAICESLGLNPLTKPLAYLKLNGTLQLYTRKDATEQLRTIRRISCHIGDPKVLDGVLYVKAMVSLPDGRTDEATGAVPFTNNLQGEARANAFMKCETKAKRRATLSICGLGLTDESEIDSIPGARMVTVEAAHGKDTIEMTHGTTPSGGTQPQDLPDDLRDAAEVIGEKVSTMLPAFQTLHLQINELAGSDAPYYEVLQSHGWEHANKETIKSAGRRKALEVARDLIVRIQAIQISLAEPDFT